MLKCKNCKSNEVKVRIIDNNSNKRIKKHICKICGYEETSAINIQEKRNQNQIPFSFFNFNGTEYKTRV